jgi:hypothetical protein
MGGGKANHGRGRIARPHPLASVLDARGTNDASGSRGPRFSSAISWSDIILITNQCITLYCRGFPNHTGFRSPKNARHRVANPKTTNIRRNFGSNGSSRNLLSKVGVHRHGLWVSGGYHQAGYWKRIQPMRVVVS